MKKLLTVLLLFINAAAFCQICTAVEAPAKDRGKLLPRTTTVQRNKIENPATGLIVFNTTIGTYSYNSGPPTSPNWINISEAQMMEMLAKLDLESRKK